jgi:hypothetical protein
MDEAKTSAPDKDQPHPFQQGLEVPVAHPGAGAMLQDTAVIEETDLPHSSGPNCALCGAPRDDQIHIEGEAEADAESPRWGL